MRSLALIALAGVACGKGDAAFGGGPREKVVAAWKEKGLVTSALTKAEVAIGKDCQSGTVDKLDVLLCVFPTEDEAKAAVESGYAWVGDATGASGAKGTVLVVIADRKKSDPSGRTINQLMK